MTTSPTFDSPRDSEREREQRRFDEADQANPSFDDPELARERGAERERGAARREAADQAGSADAGSPALGTSYLGGSSDEHWQQWRQVQSEFVDNPRSAVSDAHRLVGELMGDIVHRFESERDQLEQRWSSGQDVSTEELRTCLQTYRDFFGRLLTNVGDAKHS
ncbi:MAG TPA: hypothetical protein VNN80_14835 [Polyangiaceae bacterium]|jgi:hypothetical protein|nr:hypothetical protein [Polyangiaceae bacterium]